MQLGASYIRNSKKRYLPFNRSFLDGQHCTSIPTHCSFLPKLPEEVKRGSRFFCWGHVCRRCKRLGCVVIGLKLVIIDEGHRALGIHHVSLAPPSAPKKSPLMP